MGEKKRRKKRKDVLINVRSFAEEKEALKEIADEELVDVTMLVWDAIRDKYGVRIDSIIKRNQERPEERD